MAVKIAFYESPDPTGDGVKHFHARAVERETIRMDRLNHFVTHRCTVSESDILAVLTALSDVMVDAFLEGHRVYLRGLGYFDITLTNDEIRSLKEGNVRKVHFKSVKFVPEASLRKRLERGMKFVRASSTIPFSNRLTEEEVNEKLAGYFASHPFITRMEMQKLCGFKRSMALACINRLIDEGRLRNMGTRRTPVYVPVEGALPLPDSEAGE